MTVGSGLETDDNLRATHLSSSLLLPGRHGPNLPQSQLLPSEVRLINKDQAVSIKAGLRTDQMASEATWLVRVGCKPRVAPSLCPTVYTFILEYIQIMEMRCLSWGECHQG